jgi:ribonuclease D
VNRPTELVETQDRLLAAVDAFASAAVLAVDTESNSFFAYRERTCLVQVSTPEADWIIDPFAVDLAPFGPVLANPAIEKLFHASELDVVQLKRDFGFAVANLFDTLVAAKSVGRKKLGYASLVEEIVGIKLAKDEQRSDWGRRPLTPRQVEYAFADTRHLHAVAARLKGEVRAKGPLIEEEVAVDCVRMTEKEVRPREVDPEAFERHSSARKMDPLARQALKALFLAREARAAETDKPPFRIVGDEALGEIAVRRPVDRAELGKIPGITPAVLGRHGDLLLGAVREALEKGPLARPKKAYAAPDPLEEERFEALRAWRRTTAESRGVEVDVIASNFTLKALAKAWPRTPEALAEVRELDAFRRRLYGGALLQTLAR